MVLALRTVFGFSNSRPRLLCFSALLMLTTPRSQSTSLPLQAKQFATSHAGSETEKHRKPKRAFFEKIK